MTLREQCIALMFAESPLYLTKAQFTESLEGWTLDPVYRQDGTIGAVFAVKGAEFHFAKFGADIQATREHLKKYPGSLIQQYGYALTRTPKTEIRQQRFNERLGFFRVGEDGWDVHFRIEKLRFIRS